MVLTRSLLTEGTYNPRCESPEVGVMGPGAIEQESYAVVADGATVLFPKNLGGSFSVYTRVSAAMARRR